MSRTVKVAYLVAEDAGGVSAMRFVVLGLAVGSCTSAAVGGCTSAIGGGTFAVGGNTFAVGGCTLAAASLYSAWGSISESGKVSLIPKWGIPSSRS